jgi:stringent starvation protein B
MTDDPNAMTSHRPYLLRALYEWIADNGMTPHLLVDATMPGVRVPPHTVKDGRVVLNVAARAVSRLEMDNDAVSFTARFGGVSHPVTVPVAAVLAIYARETGQGMALPDDGLPPPDGDDHADEGEGDGDAGIHLAAVDDGDRDDGGDDTPPGDGAPPRRGHLRVVK